MNDLPKNTEPVSRESSAERGLFVVWARARHLQNRILADLGSRFRICRVREIHWTPTLVTANFQRFYSDLDLRGVYHRLNKGDGPFLAITVVDETPEFDMRMTGRGRRRVLSRFMDAKSLYREWSGGIGIHCGETAWETDRDLCMLLGLGEVTSPPASNAPWDGLTEQLHRDLTGADAWESMQELFGVLNRATRYLAFTYGDDDLSATRRQEADIDILTEDYYAAHTVLNSGRFLRPKLRNGGRVPVRIGHRVVNLGLRFPGDNYFDEAWARRLLNSRVLDARGYYRPADEEAFWVLAYHALVHKPAFDTQTRARLLSMATARGLSDWESGLGEGGQAGHDRLLSLLAASGINCPEPLDRAVSIRHGEKSGRMALRYATRRCYNVIYAAGQKLSSLFQSAYWPVRDGLLIRAPWLSKVKHWRRMLT